MNKQTETNKKENNILKALTAVRVFVFRFSVMLSICCIALALADTFIMKTKISGERFLCLALLSALVAVAMAVTDVMKSKKINSVITYTVNFVICYLSFGLIFYILRNDISAHSFNTPMYSFILLSFVFVLLYTAVAIIRIIAGAIKRKIMNNAKTYEKIYTDK